MSQKYSNNAYSTLASPLNIGGTTVFVSPGHGARWPEIVVPDTIEITLEDESANIEVCTVTAHTAGSDQMTVARAQQGTAQRNWSIGDLIETRVTAQELTAFEADIDGLEATRARHAGQAYTGAHNFSGASVTVAVPSTDQQPASKKYVDDAAFGAVNLPGQLGHGAGEAVTTNGVTASWGLPVPLWVSGTTYAAGVTVCSPADTFYYRRKTAGGGAADPSVDGANWQKTASAGIATAASITTGTTLTNVSAGYQRIAMTTMGQSVTLPDATTLAIGAPKFYLDNSAGGYPVGIRNSAGTLLMAIAAGGTAYANCEDISSPAGVWAITGTNLEPGLITIDNTFSSTYASTVLKPFVALDDNKSIHFLLSGSDLYAVAVDNTTKAVGTPVLMQTSAQIRTAFKVSSTSVIVFYSPNNNSDYLYGMVVSLTGATTLSVGSAGISGTHTNIAVEDFSGAPKIAQLASALYLISWATATGAGNTSVMAVSVSGATVTFGAKADIIAANNVADSTTTYALTATTGLVIYRGKNGGLQDRIFAVVISVSGATCTVGTPAEMGSSIFGNTFSTTVSAQLSATKFLVVGGASSGSALYGQAITISGTTATAGTQMTIETSGTLVCDAYTDSSATRYNPHLWRLSDTTAGLWYLDTSGVSRAVVLSESGGTVTAGTIAYCNISQNALNSIGFGAILPQGTTEFCSVMETLANTAGFGLQLLTSKISGTTITLGATQPLRDVAQVAPNKAIAARLASGDYVLMSSIGSDGGPVTTIPVFRANGDAINDRGRIKCPYVAFTEGAYPVMAVSSNRIVLLGSQRQGSSISSTTKQLRLLSVEIAA